MTATTGHCRHCEKPIVFGKYYVGSSPGAPIEVWYHPPGARTCLTKPAKWRGRWPMAEPKEEA